MVAKTLFILFLLYMCGLLKQQVDNDEQCYLAISINRMKLIAALSHVLLVLLRPDARRTAVVRYQQPTTGFQPALHRQPHFYQALNHINHSYHFNHCGTSLHASYINSCECQFNKSQIWIHIHVTN